MRNPVAKYAGRFNKASIVPNTKKEYAPSIDDFDVCCDEDVFHITWISPEGNREEVTLTNTDDISITKMRLNLIMMDCTFVKVFKNGEEIL